MYHWTCNSVSGGIIVLVMISQSVQDKTFVVIVWKNKQLLLHNSFIISSLELAKEVQIWTIWPIINEAVRAAVGHSEML
jgi:hypothetical protein